MASSVCGASLRSASSTRAWRLCLGVSAARFRAQIAGLESKAQTAAREKRFAEAAEVWTQVRTLMPAHPGAAENAAEMRAKAKSAEAAAFVAQGRKAREEYVGLAKDAGEKRAEAQRLDQEIPHHEGEERKLPLWRAQAAAEKAGDEAALRQAEIVVAFLSALGVDPENGEAKTALAKFYYDEYEEAEKGGKRLEMKKAEKLVGLFDDGTYAPKLLREGTIEIDSNPPGAEVELLQYEEGPDRRLVAKSVRMLGSCPIARTQLAGGSYLLILRKSGCRDARYPVLIERGTRHVGKVNLYTDEEIGKDFVYVPGGTFVMGGDPEAYLAGPRRDVAVEDFFIAKYETTMDEYRSFIEELARKDVTEARKRVPRDPAGMGALWQVEAGGKITCRVQGIESWPVMGISWDDAKAYCDWMTTKAREHGYRVTYRLPTEAEWEKAARGTDGRKYPWGNSPPDKTKAQFNARYNQTVPVDSFPIGASPYGVLDMAGNAWEWVSSAYLPYPYDSKDVREDLKAGPVRGTRGGGHDSPAEEITTTQRGRNLSRNFRSGHHNIGFRCAR